MAFNFAKAKASLRRKVHEIFGVTAFYQDSSMSEPVEIRARWHNKETNLGDLDNEGYAEIVEGIERIVFEAAEARTHNIKRGGQVWFPEYGSGMGVGLGSPLGGEDNGPPKFTLHLMRKNSGPVEEVWEVTQV
jgi:hypothetical protein